MPTMNTTHLHADATSDTTPWHIWHAAVHEISGLSYSDLEASGWLAKLPAWYQAGESCAMAAQSLTFAVPVTLRGQKVDRDGACRGAAIRAVARSRV